MERERKEEEAPATYPGCQRLFLRGFRLQLYWFFIAAPDKRLSISVPSRVSRLLIPQLPSLLTPVTQATNSITFLTEVSLLEGVDCDYLLPDWLYPMYKTQWSCMLLMSQNRDPGPSVEKFGSGALRCGRILERNSSVSWGSFSHVSSKAPLSSSSS